MQISLLKSRVWPIDFYVLLTASPLLISRISSFKCGSVRLWFNLINMQISWLVIIFWKNAAFPWQRVLNFFPIFFRIILIGRRALADSWIALPKNSSLFKWAYHRKTHIDMIWAGCHESPSVFFSKKIQFQTTKIWFNLLE